MHYRSLTQATMVLLYLSATTMLSDSKALAATQFPYWSSVTSDEKGRPPAECSQGGVARGLSCKGDRCDDMALLCDPGYETDFPEIWSEPFSEESGRNQRICPEGMLVTSLSCEGSDCNNLSIRCSSVPSYKPQRCDWSSVRMSDGPEHTASEKRFWFPEGYALAGLRCEGDLCDDLFAYLCTDEESKKYNHPDTLESPYLTGFTWAGKPPAVCDNGGAVIGLRSTGDNSGRVELVCDTRIKTSGAQNWLDGRFSEERFNSSQTCGQNALVSGLSCDGKNCDNLKLRCVEIDGYDHSKAGCFWSPKPMSDYGNGLFNSFYFDEDYAFAGMRCEGSYCDDMYAFLCKKPDRIASKEPVSPNEEIIVTETEVPGKTPQEDEKEEPNPLPNKKTVTTFKSLDPEVSKRFMVDVLGTKAIASENPSKSLVSFDDELAIIEFIPPTDSSDRKSFENLIANIDTNQTNFNAWKSMQPEVWVSDLSIYLAKVKNNQNVIGPVKRIDGAFLLFIEVPNAGYLGLISLELSAEDQLSIKQWSDYWPDDTKASEDLLTVIQGPSYGGDQGEVFNTLSDADIGDRVSEVKIHAGTFINAISVTYESQFTKTYGNIESDDKTYTLSLDRFEEITSVVICQADKAVNNNPDEITKSLWYIGLATSKGRFIANENPFEAGTMDSDCFWLRPDGQKVLGFYGRSGEGINQLGIMLKGD